MTEEMTLEEYHRKYGAKSEVRLARSARKVRFKKKAQLRSKTDWEQALLTQILDLGLPKPIQEVRFHDKRRWRFDFAWPGRKVALEVEGGIYGQVVSCHKCGTQVLEKTSSGAMIKIRRGGRHNTGKGFENDCFKYAEALILGWKVLRVTSSQIQDGSAIAWVETLLDRNPLREQNHDTEN
jgi:hypothetical protein